MDNINKEELEKMAKSLSDSAKTIKGLHKHANTLLNTVITPEVEKHLTADEKAFINDGRNSFNLNGLDLTEKLNQLTQTLRKNASIISQ